VFLIIIITKTQKFVNFAVHNVLLVDLQIPHAYNVYKDIFLLLEFVNNVLLDVFHAFQ